MNAELFKVMMQKGWDNQGILSKMKSNHYAHLNSERLLKNFDSIPSSNSYQTDAQIEEGKICL